MTTALYVRVSTSDQSMDRQLKATHKYANDNLGIALNAIDVYRDKATGTNVRRSGYREMMAAIDELDQVVVKSVSRISRSIRDLDRTVDRLNDAGVALHLIDESLVIDPTDEDPFQRAMIRVMGVFAELEADIIKARVREGIAARQEQDDYHHGRAPLGFSKDNGRLIESDQYDRVATTLEMVQKGNLSKREAADELDCGRATIDRALDRAAIYGL